MADYIYGVFCMGRDVGWIAIGDRGDAEWELTHTDDKHQPAFLARRAVGPIEITDEDTEWGKLADGEDG